jgi:CheY-like chemotaxis protein
VALIDLSMAQDMDSFALAREVRQDPQLAATRLILLTSVERAEQGRLALQAGFSAYLNRPIKRDELYAVLTGQPDPQAPAAAPAAPPTVTDHTAAPPDPQPALPVATQLPILLVEDNVVSQQLALRQLERLGYTAHVVGNGREALAALDARPDGYALVVMDCQMPEMDGFEATRIIRQGEADSERHLPIVAMTANVAPADRAACIEVGMDDYISKPVKLDALRSVLERWLLAAPQSHD